MEVHVLDMTKEKRVITPGDLMPMEEYGKIRRDHRKSLIATKSKRRLHVGPFATFHFENYDTMWAQVQEMLYIEKGGEQQVADELEAYNPLIPQGRELVATMLIEIEDEGRRRRTLATLGHIEDSIVIRMGDHRVAGVPESDIDRTTDDGKTSAVHFITFPFTEEQAAAFKSHDAKISLGIEHDQYRHESVLQDDVREELSKDLE